LNVTDAIIHFIGDGSALSHLNASNVDFGTLSTTVFPASGVSVGTYGSSANVAQVTVDTYGRVTSATNVAITSSQWTGTPGSPIYYIPGVGIGSSIPATANLQVTGNVYVSNSVTTTNVFAATEILTGTTDQTTLNVTGNVYVSNAVTTMNVFANTYYGDGGLLSNVGSQWTGNKGSPIYYIPGVGVGSSTPATANLQVTGNVYVSNALTTSNVNITDTLDVVGSLTANAANATFFFDTFTIPYINTQYLNVASNIVLTGNLSAPLANITTLNVNYLTVNSAVVYGTSTLNVYGVSNLSTATVVGSIGQTTLNVIGNVYVSNALVTTNVLAATEILTGASGQTTLNVTGNIYASNSLTTTNLFTAGIVSNVTSTKFNYDTLTIPFITCSTLNVESTSNLDVVTITGEPGLTSLNVTGNIYASNALVTTNIFANREILAGTPGQTTLNVTGNIYASNAITTTNVFASTVTASGFLEADSTWMLGSNGTTQRTFRSGNVAVTGATTTVQGTATVTFGYTAASTNYRVIATVDGGGSNFPFVVSVSSKTTTTFVVRVLKFLNATAGDVTVDWLLIE
jgi:hypothetical protein